MDRNNIHDPRSCDYWLPRPPPLQMYSVLDRRPLFAHFPDEPLDLLPPVPPVPYPYPFHQYHSAPAGYHHHNRMGLFDINSAVHRHRDSARRRRVSTASTETKIEPERMVTTRARDVREASGRKISVKFAFQDMRRRLGCAKEMCEKYGSKFDEILTVPEGSKFPTPNTINSLWADMLEIKFKNENAVDRFLDAADDIAECMLRVKNAQGAPPSDDDGDKQREYVGEDCAVRKLAIDCDQIVKLGRKAVSDRLACSDMFKRTGSAIESLDPWKEEAEE